MERKYEIACFLDEMMVLLCERGAFLCGGMNTEAQRRGVL